MKVVCLISKAQISSRFVASIVNYHMGGNSIAHKKKHIHIFDIALIFAITLEPITYT